MARETTVPDDPGVAAAALAAPGARKGVSNPGKALGASQLEPHQADGRGDADLTTALRAWWGGWGDALRVSPWGLEAGRPGRTLRVRGHVEEVSDWERAGY